MHIEEISQEIEKIHKRNMSVEADKAWETSFTRRCLIALFTYILIVLFMYFSGLKNYWINAIVPTIGFILSTLSFPLFKKIWLKYYRRKK